MKYSFILEREPRGVSLVEKYTNFHLYGDIVGSSLIKESTVWQAISVGCSAYGRDSNRSQLG